MKFKFKIVLQQSPFYPINIFYLLNNLYTNILDWANNDLELF